MLVIQIANALIGKCCFKRIIFKISLLWHDFSNTVAFHDIKVTQENSTQYIFKQIIAVSCLKKGGQNPNSSSYIPLLTRNKNRADYLNFQLPPSFKKGPLHGITPLWGDREQWNSKSQEAKLMGPLIANLRISFIALFVVVSVGGGGRGLRKRRWGHWYSGEEWGGVIHGMSGPWFTDYVMNPSLFSPFCQSRAGGPVTKSAIVLIKFHFAEFMKREAIFEVWVEPGSYFFKWIRGPRAN